MSIGHRLHARCACSAARAPFALAGTERKYERARPFAVSHLFLDLALDFKQRSVEGSATLSFERRAPDAGTLELDAVGFEIASVRLDAGDGFGSAEFDYDGDTLSLHGLDGIDAGRVAVEYRALPRRGMYFLAPDATVKDRPRQVWTQCQDEDARHWFPCHDKPHMKMTTELRVRVPPRFTVLSNGELVQQSKPAGKPWTYHFKLDRPHPSYLVTLVAGDFSVVTDRPANLGKSGKIPIEYYLPPARKKDAARSFGETPRMVELFSRLTGTPFPWSRYSQIVVSDFIFGGMENTTATTMYEHVLLDERAAIDISSNDLVAHELAHQWFGDYVTCRDWSHAWLNEGFATFFEHIEREDRLGRDEYDWGIAGDLDSYLSEAGGRYSRAIVCRDYAEPIDLFDRHLYEKGGLVLHMLRRELGDATFWAGVRRYLSAHAHGIVETGDLVRALELESGRSLERFFDCWVYRPGHPELKLKISYEDGLLSLQLKQAQKVGDIAVFAFTLEVEVGKKDGSKARYTKAITEANDTLVVSLPERPSYVAFDPDFRVTTSVELEAPADMLRAQLAQASLALSRCRAADALSRRDDPQTLKALAAALSNKKEAWMVRAEAARALGKLRSDEALAELLRHVKEAQPKVRRAVVAALGNFKKTEAARVLAALISSEKSYLVLSEAARSLGRTRDPRALQTLLKIVDRPSWADVSRVGALDGLAALRDESALPAVLSRTRYGIPTRGRRAAIAAAARLSDSREVREKLEELLEDHDPHLKIEVVAALESLNNPQSRGVLSRAKARELDGRVLRRLREALRDMGDSGAAERKRLNDELDNVKGELGELKARLSKLEGAKRGAADDKSSLTRKRGRRGRS